MTILERTHYYAKPGLAADVLATRRQASAIRLAMGLPAGDIAIRAAGDDGSGPDVAWTCAFQDEKAHARDLEARGKSPEFAAIREKMRSVIARFERQLFETVDLGLASGLRQTSLSGHPIVPQVISFTSGGYRLSGYLHLPPGDGPFPLVITNHGSGIDKGTEDVSRPGTAALLMSWGIASFLPHRRGYGNSEGPGWREEVSAPSGSEAYDTQLAERLHRESDDILAALDILRAHPRVDPAHIGIMGSSFGGTTTLLAASRTQAFTCAIDFAGAAMNWDRTPGLRELMHAAAKRLTMPILFVQAANDYSIRPTLELPAALAGTGKVFDSIIYPAFGINHHEGHLLESRGPTIWAADIRHFLERHL